MLRSTKNEINPKIVRSTQHTDGLLGRSGDLGGAVVGAGAAGGLDVGVVVAGGRDGRSVGGRFGDNGAENVVGRHGGRGLVDGVGGVGRLNIGVSHGGGWLRWGLAE